MSIWSDNMYMLNVISAMDLFLVCLITMILVIIMVLLILMTSKKTKEEKQNIAITVEEKKEPIDEKPRTDIEAVLNQMENELEQGPKTVSHTFEEEQEEKAIISYRELLKVAGKLKEEIRENEEAMEKSCMPFSKLEEPKEELEDKKFKKTEFISPVYGKQPDPTHETYGTKKKEAEEDFLSQLKDLRKNLE